MTTHKEHPPAEAEGRQDQPGGRSGHSLPARSDIAGDLAYAADVYARAGWPVFPCKPGAKVPLTRHGFKDASADPQRVRAWWRRNPLANIGAPTGVAFDVLDVDVRADGNGWGHFADLATAGLIKGAFAKAVTRNGGGHYFYARSGAGCRAFKGKFLDVKASGGYVALPPSRVPADDGINGPGAYSWVEFDLTTDRRPLDVDAIARFLAPPRAAFDPTTTPRTSRSGSFWDQFAGSGGNGGIESLVRWLEGEGEGNRNQALYWAARRAVEANQLDPAARRELAAAAERAGLPSAAVKATLDSAEKGPRS